MADVPDDWKTLYRNALNVVETIDWKEIVAQEGKQLPPPDEEDEEEHEGGISVVDANELTEEEVEEMAANAIFLGIGIVKDSVPTLLEAWDHWRDHGCASALPILDGMLELIIGMIIEKTEEDE